MEGSLSPKLNSFLPPGNEEGCRGQMRAAPCSHQSSPVRSVSHSPGLGAAAEPQGERRSPSRSGRSPLRRGGGFGDPETHSSPRGTNKKVLLLPGPERSRVRGLGRKSRRIDRDASGKCGSARRRRGAGGGARRPRVWGRSGGRGGPDPRVAPR